MKNYDHKKIEKKWQKIWEEKKVYKTQNPNKLKKMYVLDMFPYPSGAGLHVGHPRGYIGSDVYARMKRMQGYNVLHPMGYDAFGLPAEQYAIEHKIHPRKAVEENVKTFERQLKIIGLSYDWSRKVNTTDPKFYKWTQWIFLKIYNSWYDKTKDKARLISELESIFEKSGNGKVNAVTSQESIFTAKEWKSYSKKEKQDVLMKYRLAYEGYSEVNWCPHMGTVLANDEIVTDKNGNLVSERGGYPVEKKLMRQWFMRITAYAERLLKGLEKLDWSNHIKEIQKNWIGKSIGSEIEFIIKNHSEKIKVFTTRADTIFGATYVVIAPEHALVQKLKKDITNWSDVDSYISSLKNKSEEERTSEEKEKTGVELKGITAINPSNGEEIPVWIADYVLATYGTGSVMAVPAHDTRDFQFAKKYKLPIKHVIAPLLNIEEGEFGFRNDKKTVERKCILAIIKHWEKDEYLVLESKKHNWKTFVIGGMESEENEIDSAKREIEEETGFTDLKFVKTLGDKIFAKHFAPHKDENRFAELTGLYFELNSGAQVNVSQDEQSHQSVKWIKPSDIPNTLYPKITDWVFWQRLIKENDGEFVDDGIVINSNKFNGMSSEEAREKITEFVGGKIVTKYKMRDAVFARQRYWGEPIPLKHNAGGIITELKEKDLPLELPNVKSYEPMGTGESPLAGVKSWVKEGFETNTMPGWAGSSWYFLRYMDPKNSKKFANDKELKYWRDVDMYVGGQEHATGHLLYSRFWNNFLFDLGCIPEKEPFKKLKNQGMILASDGHKMSKRWGNVINPDDIVHTYGADTLRVYEMFMGPFDQSLPWSTESIIGSRRFIDRIFRLKNKVSNKTSVELEKVLHKTIKKVSEGIEEFSFNTCISSMMIFINELEKSESISVKDFKLFLQILAPYAPHVTEEIWRDLGEKKSIHLSPWPKWDKKKIVDETIKIAIQVNGKVRGEIVIDVDMEEELVKDMAVKDSSVIPWIEKGVIKRIIYVKGRIINIVV